MVGFTWTDHFESRPVCHGLNGKLKTESAHEKIFLVGCVQMGPSVPDRENRQP